MRDRRCNNILLGLGLVSCFIVLLFAAVRLPFMAVVRNNMQSGIDADAYFYSEVQGFHKHETAVAGKHHPVDRLAEEWEQSGSKDK